eukprot:scaffold3771_cov110-Skeletonema_dohrnii-CCMP3373.AAC.10
MLDRSRGKRTESMMDKMMEKLTLRGCAEIEGAKVCSAVGCAEIEGDELGPDEGLLDNVGLSDGFELGAAELDGDELGSDEGSVEVDGDELGPDEGLLDRVGLRDG